ncbi:MAG: hypothetical protein ACE5F5_05210 [Acidimicrobiia bacterium]
MGALTSWERRLHGSVDFMGAKKGVPRRLIALTVLTMALTMMGITAVQASDGNEDWHPHSVTSCSCYVKTRGGEFGTIAPIPEASTASITTGVGVIGARLKYWNVIRWKYYYTSWVYRDANGVPGIYARATVVNTHRAVRSYHYAEPDAGGIYYFYETHYVEDFH